MHEMSFVPSNELPEWKKKLIRQKRASFEKKDGGMSSAKQEGSRFTRTGGHRDVYSACRESNQSGLQMPCSTSRSWNVSALSGRGCLNKSHIADNKMVEENDLAAVEKQDNLCSNTADTEPDLEYGPGIVDKLKSRFIHLTLKDSQKRRAPLRRFCSLENLVQEEPFQAIESSKGDGAIAWRNRAKYGLSSCGKANFVKAQSMETLVIKSDERNRGVFRTNKPPLVNDNIVIVENAKDSDERDVTKSVANEELPRPDTVKTYKRMFEPAESKPVHRRRPPVLRASAKSTKSLVKSSAMVNGDESNRLADNYRSKERRVSPPIITDGLIDEKKTEAPVMKNLPPAAQGSLVFDFRGKSTKPNVSLQPTPFGCKPVQKAVRKNYRLFDGIEGMPVGGVTWDDDDFDDELDGQTDLPHPSGITFIGENVRLEKNCLLSSRNKNLTIRFNDNATSIHEYPSELSLLETNNIVNGIHDETNSSPLSFSGGLASYTPKGLETVKPFQLGVVKPPSQLEVPEINNTEEKETEVLKPADPDSTFSWSSSTTTSDLLF